MMNSYVMVKSKLQWTGQAEFSAIFLPPAELEDLLIEVPEQGYQVGVTVDIARFKYKKRILERICDGILNGSVRVKGFEVEWLWEPECLLDGNKVDLEDIIDDINIEQMAGEMLDGAESGSLDVTVEYSISLDIAARSGKLVMGTVNIDSMDLPDVYVDCNFASDCTDVIFDESLDLSESAKAAVINEITRMIESSEKEEKPEGGENC